MQKVELFENVILVTGCYGEKWLVGTVAKGVSLKFEHIVLDQDEKVE